MPTYDITQITRNCVRDTGEDVSDEWSDIYTDLISE